ncbi:MAG: LCP family protein [Clostridia bacterium]|nr:LCP family protein [Clostridia bacterium]
MTERRRSKRVDKQKQKQKRTILTVLAVILAAAVLAVGVKLVVDKIAGVPLRFFGLASWNGSGDLVDDNGDLIGEDPGVLEQLMELRTQSDLSTILKEWATNGGSKALMQSKKVINFLLVGMDESGSNSDVLMMLTLNNDTKKIFLTSFMRDSYTYIKSPNGDVYAKVNASYANGGMDCLINTLQNDYKIRIHHYVCVNFQTFAEIVDALGGVRLPVKDYEAKEMDRADDKHKGVPYVSGDDVLLNGYQALMYCRIRYCDADGDVSRTRRQRLFVTTLMERARTMSVDEATAIIKSLMQYVTTDCTASELISLATKTLVNRWYEYEVTSFNLPEIEDRMDYSGSQWVWIVDYPAAAQKLQLAIYGKTNIALNADRLTAIDVMKDKAGAGYYVEEKHTGDEVLSTEAPAETPPEPTSPLDQTPTANPYIPPEITDWEPPVYVEPTEPEIISTPAEEEPGTPEEEPPAPEPPGETPEPAGGEE